MNSYITICQLADMNNWLFNEDIPHQQNPETLLIQKEFGKDFSKEAKQFLETALSFDEIPTIKRIQEELRKEGMPWDCIRMAKKEIRQVLSAS